jgi:hypothetical protein
MSYRYDVWLTDVTGQFLPKQASYRGTEPSSDSGTDAKGGIFD